MLNVKLEELPMPTTDRSIDRLVGWFVESFCFVRRKGDATADYGSASPIHRMLRAFTSFRILKCRGMHRRCLMN